MYHSLTNNEQRISLQEINVRAEDDDQVLVDQHGLHHHPAKGEEQREMLRHAKDAAQVSRHCGVEVGRDHEGNKRDEQGQ